MFVVATAGHVDHGKSTLVHALTGMEPDRWDEERRRGLTIDLGFAWTQLPSGREVAFVDVPGHERFIGNMLAGLGPAPVVCFVVAADDGWQAQSSDHRDAVAALGIRHGVLVVTRADLAPDRVDEVVNEARTELGRTELSQVPAVVVSATQGSGMDSLRTALDDVLSQVEAPPPGGRVRLWIDRSFTITGAGTVVTGTLSSGSVTVGDRLQVLGSTRQREAVVRGLQSRGAPHTSLGPVNRVALNLRGVATDEVHRGDALVTPDSWPTTAIVDVRHVSGQSFPQVPEHLTIHVGTAAVPARMRPFDDDHARLTLDHPLPLIVGDRVVLRDPGSRRVLGGALVLDADPPALRRRGDGVRWSAQLAQRDPAGDLVAEVSRRGAVTRARLQQLGLVPHEAETPADVREIGAWWVHRPMYAVWQRRLQDALNEQHARDPLAGGLSRGAARDLLGLADDALLDAVVADAGLVQETGVVRLPGSRNDLGAADEGIRRLEVRLAEHPFRAPEADDLVELRLGRRELAAAERAGRILRLTDGVVLLPTAPALAMRTLSQMEQPFTTSGARKALDTTRRVAIPLLEHLDGRGWTRRLDAGHREVVR